MHRPKIKQLQETEDLMREVKEILVIIVVNVDMNKMEYIMETV